jgi:hypothetical protein
LDNYWNDTALQPVFPPFLREAVAYLSGAGGFAVARTAGEVLDAAPLFAGTTNAATRSIVVTTPAGERQTLDSGGGTVIGLEDQGFYALRVPGQERARSVAVNVDFSESDLGRISQDEIRREVVNTESARTTSTEDVLPADNERRQSIWWWLLVFAALLLVSESIISNRLSRVARA